MLGKQLMLESSYWTMGDGRRLVVYHDNWLPTLSSFKIVSPHVLFEEAKVSDLLTSEGVLNINLIKCLSSK